MRNKEQLASIIKEKGSTKLMIKENREENFIFTFDKIEKEVLLD